MKGDEVDGDHVIIQRQSQKDRDNPTRVTPAYSGTPTPIGDITHGSRYYDDLAVPLAPVLGSAHASDVQNIYGAGELTDYLVQFAVHLDPNGGSSPQWPQYTTSPHLMTAKSRIQLQL
ncbi:hypothetical protein EDB87DRAFT_1574904 [Lactarius vividus]|nr:hypothetical protein EDB87DRAFT_1574904 [Lactarius vividus]